MATDDEKRSSSQGIDQLPLPFTSPAPGVGARQEETTSPSAGGGYQDNCTVLNFRPAAKKKRDPRLEELHEMGLQRVWLEVAECIGVDNMLAMWRILCNSPLRIDGSGRLMVPIKDYRAYHRYQRNRYIETLAAQGFSHEEIRKILIAQIGENVSKRHISRISTGR